VNDRRQALVDTIIILSISIIIILIYFQDTIADPAQIAIGASDIDLPAQIWLLWWENHPNKDILVNHPVGNVDFYVLTPVHSWLASWCYPQVVLAHNIASCAG